MQELEVKIDGIEMKLRKLLRKAELLQKENKELFEENIKLKKELQESIDIVKTETTLASNANKTASDQDINKMKEELDGYIEEVTNCINLLEA